MKLFIRALFSIAITGNTLKNVSGWAVYYGMIIKWNKRQPIKESIISPHQYGKFLSMLNEKRICSMFSFVIL